MNANRHKTTLLLALVVLVDFGQVHSWGWPSFGPFFGGMTSGTSKLLGIKTPSLFSSEPVFYGDLGNFSRFPLSEAFKLPAAIGGFYPMPPENIGVKFFMYTCKNRYRPYEIIWNATDDYVKESPFDKDLRTIFIIHGYMDLYEEMNWMGDMKDFILDDQLEEAGRRCHHNVIGVDWRKGSQVTLYPKAVANTMVVGAVVARHIKQLIRLYGNTPKDFTVVGHSLGAHTSGFVGKRFQDGEKLRNILGLDPAGPAFTDVPNSYRLNPNDAKLVLTIHTNGGKVLGDNFGMLIPLGHYSFFPNGGHQQTGCEKTMAVANILLNGVVGGLTDTVACSHRRATRLVQFNESMLTYAQGVGYVCDSYANYAKGKCGTCSGPEQCKPFSNWFGWWQEQVPPKTWTKPISYFLDTTNMIPWSMFAFQVIVETGDIKPFNGSLQISPIGRLRDGPEITIQDKSDDGNLKSNSKYTYLVKVPKDLGQVRRAFVKLVGGPNADKTVKVTLKSVTFNFLSNHDSSERQKLSATLTNVKEFGVGERVLFSAPLAQAQIDLNDKLEAAKLELISKA